MSETRTCPLPTPELVAALANQLIEELLRSVEPHVMGDIRSQCEFLTHQYKPMMDEACRLILGDGLEDSPLTETLRQSAWQLAGALNFPAPYETEVTLQDGSTLPPERHTITYFTDGEGFAHEDWAAISALEVGESYTVRGDQAAMTVTRVA